MANECEVCGGPIDRSLYPRAATCGGTCRRNKSLRALAMKRRPAVRDCRICGKSFCASYTTRIGAHGTTRRAFCSPECAAEYRRQQEAIESATVYAEAPKTAACHQCGREYRIRQGKDGMRKYCSRSCKNAAARTVVAKCERCGVEFRHQKHSKGRFCSVACCESAESERFAASREAKKAEIAAKHREFRRQAAARLAVFRRCKSAAEVARMFAESENKSHEFLDGCRGYKRAQARRTKESVWRKAGERVGRISKAYPRERAFCAKLESLLRAANVPFVREADVPGPTGRRVDFLLRDLFRTWAVEAKNTRHASDVDCCVGQAIVRALPFRAVPVVAFPSDIEIDETARAACKSLGVVIVSELDIVERWTRYDR